MSKKSENKIKSFLNDLFMSEGCIDWDLIFVLLVFISGAIATLVLGVSKFL